jgi:fibronectin type 3 domain-containing protein
MSLDKDFPVTEKAYKTVTSSEYEIYILKLNSSGKLLDYSTFIGGNSHDILMDMCIDNEGCVHITGDDNSYTIPITIDNNVGGVFVLKLNPDGSQIEFSQAFRILGPASGNSIKLDTLNNIVIGGDVYGEFPTTPGAFQTTKPGGRIDGIIFKLQLLPPPNPPENLIAMADDGYVQLNWSPPIPDDIPIINYSIFRGSSPLNISPYTRPGNITGFNDTNVTNGVTYYYAVGAVNGYGTGNLTNLINATPGAPPTPPMLLRVITGDRYIQLLWDPPSDIKGFPVTNYKVFRGDSASNLSLFLTSNNNTKLNDTTVENGIFYYYAVSAVNARGESNISNVVSGAAGRPPTVPRNVLFDAGDRYVSFKWDAPADNGGFKEILYKVYRSTNRIDFFQVYANTTLSFNDTDVETGKTYYYCITATNNKGEGPDSGLITVQPGRPPVAPVLTVVAGTDRINLSWTVADNGGFNITSFNIYRGTNQSQLRFLANVTAMKYEDTSAQPGVVYYYIVTALNIKGESQKSNAISGVIPSKPSVPQNITALAGDGVVRLSWELPELTGGVPMVGYNIYKGAAEQSYSMFKQVPELLFNDTTVENGVTYYYRISAVNTVGESELSIAFNAKPIGPPGKILNLTAKEGDGYVLLEWQPPEKTGGVPITEYWLFRGQNATNFTLISNSSETRYNDTAVVNGASYIYSISALNSVRKGDAVEKSATPGAPPDAPQDLRIQKKDGMVVLKWNPPVKSGGFQVTGYNVYRGSSADKLEFIGLVTDATYTDKDVLAGKTYHYTVTAINKRGESPQAAVKAISIPAASTDMTMIFIAVAVIVAVFAVTLVIFIRRKKRIPDTK